jgi:hypothetical protein
MEKQFEFTTDIFDMEKGKLTQEGLYNEIVEYITSNNVCTLAFAYDNVPRATPVEYRNDGATIYVVSESLSHQQYQKGAREKIREWKLMFLERNPRCCVGIISPYFEINTSRGLQIWGKAQVFRKGDKEWERGCELLKVKRSLADFGHTEIPDFLVVTRVVPEMMQYFNMVKGIKRAQWVAPGVNPDTWNYPWE